jgi:sugar phosphate isomerase/epimerase
MNSNTLTAQLYNVREFLKTPDDIEQSLKKVKSIGYNSVQLSGLGPIAPEHLKDMVDRIGLKIATTHSAFELFTEDIDNLIKAHQLWDSRYVGIGAMPKPMRTSAEGFRSFISQIAGPARKIREAGLEFIYHNHKFEFQKFDGITGMEILMNETDPDDFGLELDTYWIQAGGGNPVEWIKKVDGRMKVVHLKDMAIIEDQQVFAEIGQGNLNWPEIIKACRDTNVVYYCVEQDSGLRDPFVSLAMSHRYLKPYFVD